MILSIMLVALGFLIATLLALMFAPSFWRRAERLTTRRIEQSMPMSIAETEADRDQLRASYAIIIRRLESALSQEKMRSARQLVKISQLQMEVANLADQAKQLRGQLDAEHNAASVLRRTIATRVPELNHAANQAKQLVHVRDNEIDSIVNRLRQREEALAIAQRTTEMQQAEIARLRQAMEMSAAQNAGRFKMRPTQWSIHDYRAEYDRLNVELSKLRERLSVAYDREANQITQLRTELQQLADQIVTTATALPEREPSRAITDATGERREQRQPDAAEAEADMAAMRSIDAIISDEISGGPSREPAVRKTAATVSGQRDTALARAASSSKRLARGAVATVAGLAGATRNAVSGAVSGETASGSDAAETPKPGQVGAARLLGGAAVPDEKQTPESAAGSSAAASLELAGSQSGSDAKVAAATEKTDPASGRSGAEPAGEVSTEAARDIPQGHWKSAAEEAPATPAEDHEDDGSLYDSYRAAKPMPGKLASEAGATDTAQKQHAGESPDGPEDAAPGSYDEKADADGNDTYSGSSPEDETGVDADEDETSDAGASTSSLLDRLKHVPENQTR